MKVQRILSTKKLTPAQEKLLLIAGLPFVSYDAIEITPLHFEAPKLIENAIFSSQNGVQSFFQNKKNSSRIKHCFCVGQKTASKLIENGQNVVKMTKNALELAHFITKTYKNDSFWFICGSHRRDDIPKRLKEAKIPVFELKTYKIELKPKGFDQIWDKIMFFSPSGVESFVAGQITDESSDSNRSQYFANTTAICIGDTTASTAKKYINNVIVANSTTVESVIAATVKTMTNDKN